MHCENKSISFCFESIFIKLVVQSVVLGSCLADLDEKTFVIDSQDVLDSLYFITEQNGHTCSKPIVDFSAHTILAQYASGQCENEQPRSRAIGVSKEIM